MSRTVKRTVCLLLSVAMAIISIFTMPIESVEAEANDYSTIRVKLASMGSTTSVNITVTGVYSIQNITDSESSSRNNVLLRNGVTYNFRISGGKIIMTPSGESTGYTLGSRVTLYSHTTARNGYLTMRNAKYGNCNYLGNMTLSVSDGVFLFINELNLDDYLCGVVPYEMSNGQMLESLKTQAICARSYAYNFVVSGRNSGAASDIVDTTSNQVYKGYNPSYTRAIMAVDQTACQILTYNGKCITTYYSASNGGITEDNHNAWGGTKLPYLNVNVDPYDTVSRNRVYRLSKTDIYSKNQTILLEAAKTSIQNSGYDYSSASVVSIDGVSPVYFDEPSSLPATQRRVYSVTYSFTVRAKRSGSNSYTTFQISVTQTRERARLFLYYTNTSNSYSTLPSTIYTVSETADEFIVTVNGNGHGIGLSQNGTYARAAAGQKYDEILAFYFQGALISTLKYKSVVMKQTPSGEYSETQVSELTPVTDTVIGEINTTVSLYPKAGAIYTPSGIISSGTRVAIVGKTSDWYEISAGDSGTTHFIQKKYVTIDSEASELPVDEGIMRVGIVSSDVWVRSAPEYQESNIITKLRFGSEVIVADTVGAFYKIYYNDSFAYASIVNVELTDERVYAVYNAEVRAYKASLYKEKNERTAKNGYLPEGATVKVFDISYGFAGLIYNGEISYIKTENIEIDGTTSTGVVLPGKCTQIDVNLKISVSTNLYSSPDTNSAADGTLEADDVVNAITLKDDWYTIIYGDGFSYVEAGDVAIYSENIMFGYAVATADKIMYSSPSCDTAVVILKAGDTVQVVKSADGETIFIYDGMPCYADNDNLRIELQEKTV